MANRDLSSAGRVTPVTDVSPVDLRRGGNAFIDESEALVRAMKDAMGALSALGDFWGGDEYGHAFYAGANGQKGYRDALLEIERHVGNVDTAYERIGTNLGRSGVNVTAAEWATIGGLAQVVYDGPQATPVTKAEVV